MPTLANNGEAVLREGLYAVITTMSSGTSKLQISIDGGTTFTDITDASWSSTTTANVRLPKCTVKAVLTGDADMNVRPVGDY